MELNETDKIRDFELERRAAGQRLESISERMLAIEQRHVRAVEGEWETENTRALSNAQKRTVEVRRRLESDDAYPRLRAEYNGLMERKELLRIDIDYLLREEQRRLCDVLERQLSVVCLNGAVRDD